MTTEKKDTARDQAQAQYKSIAAMIRRLIHAQECDGGEDCEATDEEIITGNGYWYKEGQEVTEEDRENYHDEDAAREVIERDPLSIEVRSDWHAPGDEAPPDSFNILLCTGGPACRLLGDLDEHGTPTRVWMEYQDWGTPWTEYYGMTDEERAALLIYAEQFYFGE